MNLSIEPETSAPDAVNSTENFRRFAIFAAGLSVVFAKPLYDLVRFASGNPFYSHILLIPFVTGYFLWKEKNFRTKSGTCPWAATLCFVLGLAALVLWLVKRDALIENNYLTLTILAFVFFIGGSYLLLLGKSLFDAAGFPVAFLVFLVPFPDFVTNWLETFFQHTSAAAAYAMLQLTNTPVYRQGLEFRLPNIVLSVAPECSGIRSTLVLLITSIIAGHLFLRGPWKKITLALFVIPLAVVRNGFRIFTIAQLCVYRGPEMVDSFIHKRGGPIFFILSLIPFFLLLIFLRKAEAKSERTAFSKN